MCQKTEGTPKRKIIFLTEGNIRTQQPTFQEGGLKASGITPLYYTIYKHLCNLLPTLSYSEITQNKKITTNTKAQRKILLNGNPERLCSFIFSQKKPFVFFNDEKTLHQ